MKSTFVVPAVGAGILMGAAALPARAATYTVTDNVSLINAINDINTTPRAGGTDDTINITGSLQLTLNQTLDIPPVLKSVTINGNNHSIDDNGDRAFVVGDGTNVANPISVSFNNLTIENAVAQGGSGGASHYGGAGGGGAGLGGAVFVNSNADVTLNSVSFSKNTAKGGVGGNNNSGYYGGGGAMNGGNGSIGDVGGGGGGGLQGNGGAASENGGSGGAPSGGSGGVAVFGGSGPATGGAGGASVNPFGGGGGGQGISLDSAATGGAGAGSTYGGGGSENLAGGEGSTSTFGGGDDGLGGFGAGAGSPFVGGGGAGFGGAVFVRTGGSLTISGDTDISNNSVTLGNNGGQSGGNGIFIGGLSSDATGAANLNNVTFNIASGKSTSVSDDIVDGYYDAGHEGDPAHYNVSPGGAGSITKGGDGTLILGGKNTFTGGTTVNGGTLQVFNAYGAATLGDVNTTNGVTEGLFHDSNNAGGRLEDETYTTELGHQTITGTGVGNYGNNDLYLILPSKRNSDTVTVNGIEADGAIVNIGGGNNSIGGSFNNYEVIINTQSGDANAIKLTDSATVTLSGGTNEIYGINNHFTNTVNGDVSVDGGVLSLQGGTFVGADNSGSGGSSAGYSAIGVNGNKTTNQINGHVDVNNDGVFLVDGERNIVTGGVYVTSTSGAHVGDADVSGSGTAGALLTIHNELSTSEITADAGGHIHIGTNDGSAAQAISGDYKTITNRIIGVSDDLEGTITVKGDASVLGLGDGLHDSNHGGLGDLHFTGSDNTINNLVSPENTFSQNAQLQTVTTGGEVLLGGRKVLSDDTGNAVNNTVDQDVTLGVDSGDSGDSGILALAGTGSGSTAGDNAAVVTNVVTGNVVANGTSTIFFSGADGDAANNKIGGAVTLNDNSYGGHRMAVQPMIPEPARILPMVATP